MEHLPSTTSHRDPHPTQLNRRRSSLTVQWIRDQRVPSSTMPPAGTRPNPWLAYPENPERGHLDDTSTAESYDLVDDIDIPPPPRPTTSPRKTHSSSPRSSVSLRFLPTASLKNFGFSLRASAFPNAPPPNPNPSPKNIPRNTDKPRIDSTSARRTSHQRTSSLSTQPVVHSQDATSRSSLSSSTRWRPHFWGNPSIASQVSVQDADIPPRPSLTLTRTATTTTSTTYFDRDHSSASQVSLMSTNRNDRRPHGAASRLSVFSQGSSQGSHAPSRLPDRIPFKDKFPGNACENGFLSPPPVPHSPRKMSSKVQVSNLGIRQSRKKTLVIGGISPERDDKLDAALKWCQSFGEVRNVTRQPNGDLHVSFRSAEVADTVCRVRSQVYITKVGSVQLSWIAGSGHHH